MGSRASSLLVGAFLGRIFTGSALAAAHFAQEWDGRIHTIPHGWWLIPTALPGQSCLGEVSQPGPAGGTLPRHCSGTCCRKQTLKDIFYKAMMASFLHCCCKEAGPRLFKATGQPSLLPAEPVLPQSTHDSAAIPGCCPRSAPEQRDPRGC